MRRLAHQGGSTLVELLVAAALGLVVVLACVKLLETHSRLALRVQAELGASGGAAWALRAALRDVKAAGADPRQVGLSPFGEAGADAATLLRDANADGAIDPGSAETIGLHWSGSNGGQMSRRVGTQSMPVVGEVPRGAFRLRYYDETGREVFATGGLPPGDLARIRRVEADLEVVDRIGTIAGRASLTGAASVRVREGRP